MSGPVAEDERSPGATQDGERKNYFGEYPPDFFDLIIIDECHRGGANDESNWRGILEYFAPAVQLGLTATPKRKDNADTYAYFGERSEEHTSELQSLMRISYAVFCLQKKKLHTHNINKQSNHNYYTIPICTTI